jgi:hypothetical protein
LQRALDRGGVAKADFIECFVYDGFHRELRLGQAFAARWASGTADPDLVKPAM